ncbi:MAG TPA: hypothetical protein VM165_24610, partial [Planctomycetaceae bacterium]|nr:hypothetical protein [Planctomycetaceae bacterium]
MSRSVNALTAMAFGYVRYAIAIVSGFFVLPMVLAHVDGATYSQWLVTIEILSYLGFVELGLGTLLPWLVAECDGRKDREALRRLLADARACCIVSCTLYLTAFAALWWFAPSLVGMEADAAPLLGFSVWLVVGCTCISFFGRMHTSILDGLQDYLFL